MINFHRLNPQVYLSGAVVLGLLQFIDGISALAGYSGRWNLAFSLLEVCWFIVTVVFFVAFSKQNIDLLVPKLFLAYTLYGLVIGGSLLSANKAEGLPAWYMLSAALFGIIYLLASIHTLKKIR